MARLTRARAQELNRAKVLAAAREEFAELGFRDAKIDGIAERAGLTRGAVYSNFPGKRALYFAVLADLAESAPGRPRPPGRGRRRARRSPRSPAPGSRGSRSPPSGTARNGSPWT
ncbi:TetR/AcrR family transcriptional regulator [Actinomadura yumaensis]|uniref:TetR/AcrR family transcriptional regulator n=1 Tax=Actinomadura TaxID=1988 RepID=UPI0028155A42|nr:helix-turn-helix domain-containing protein [Actinomadura sp. J1-007]